MTWASSITMGSCPECCGSPATCIGCTGQTTYPPSYNVTFTITNPGIWDPTSITGCSGTIGWSGVTPNDGNCLYDFTSTCTGTASHPLFLFNLSWFHGKTFSAVTSGIDLFSGEAFDYKGCEYLAQAKCSQDVYMPDGSLYGTFETQLYLLISISSPGSVTYFLGLGGVFKPGGIGAGPSWTRVDSFPLTWGCSGSTFTSASSSFNLNSPGPSGFDYSLALGQLGGTYAGSLIVTP